MVSAVGSAVALLGRAAEAGSRAGEHCSRADERARTMWQRYTEAAEESGQDAPRVALRQVSDAQERLLEARNRLHLGAQALHAYAQDVAPALAGDVTPEPSYHPTGQDLLELPAPASGPRARRATRTLVRRLDDVADASQAVVDLAQTGKSAFRKLPAEPGPTAAVSRQPPPEAPAARPADTGVSASGIADSVVVLSVVVLSGKRFVTRISRMFKAGPGDGAS